jgi:hypothetical protein
MPADRNSLDILARPKTDSANSDSAQRLVHRDTENPYARAFDPPCAGHRKSNSDAVHIAAAFPVRRPDRDVDAIHFLHSAIAKIDAETVDAS